MLGSEASWSEELTLAASRHRRRAEQRQREDLDADLARSEACQQRERAEADPAPIEENRRTEPRAESTASPPSAPQPPIADNQGRVDGGSASR